MAASSGGLKRLAADAPDGPAYKERSSIANPGSSRDYFVVMKGVNKGLRNCDPIIINRNLIKTLDGRYSAITVLPSGYLCVRRASSKQVQNLLGCSDIGDNGKSILD